MFRKSDGNFDLKKVREATLEYLSNLLVNKFTYATQLSDLVVALLEDNQIDAIEEDMSTFLDQDTPNFMKWYSN
jgi:hypothetical protein